MTIHRPADHIPLVGIRAEFHRTFENGIYEIVITPKMSVGTGHHPTILMMIEMMSELDFKEKAVFDFGTGIGILTILSEKSGASNIIAIDNDDQSIKNVDDNFHSNNCARIKLIKASSAEVGQSLISYRRVLLKL